MAEMTFDEVYEAAKRLPPEQQEELVRRLSPESNKGAKRLVDALPLDNVGPWPDALSLRRKDMYGDDGR